MQTNQNMRSLKHLWRLLQKVYFHKNQTKQIEKNPKQTPTIQTVFLIPSAFELLREAHINM